MNKIISMAVVGIICLTKTNAQQFIDKAVVEYEVKTNLKKTIGNGTWAEMMKENLPQFKTGYYQFSFSGNKSIYKFKRWDEKAKIPEWMSKDDELSIYFTDHNSNRIYQQKYIVGSNFLVEDSIPKIEWRVTNESRMIAGFNCRKAVGKIMDSVYVFAFYTDEIMIPGGPCIINGLPGMILGVTIPRMYTSFIATKVSLTGVNEEDLKPALSKKYNNRAALKTLISERAKEWSSEDNEDSKAWRNQFIWGALL